MMIDVTGRHADVPSCPMHPMVALEHEYRPRPGGKTAFGFWRCPLDNKVYIDQQPGFPTQA